MKKLAFILLLLSLHASPAAGLTTNWTTVAIMPFHNTSGDKALELWQEQFAQQVSYWLYTAQPFKFEVVEGSKVRSALASHAWKSKKQVPLELAQKVGRELRCGAVILGDFSRAEGLWKAKIRIVRLGSTGTEQTVQAQDRSVHQLQLQLWEQTCAALQVTPYPAAIATARAYPLSDSTWEKLARLKQPKTRHAARGFVKAARDILASEPNCLHARACLAWALRWLEQRDQAVAESRRIVQQAPDLCPGHLSLAASLDGAKHDQEREQELLAALKVHPGCPEAIKLLFEDWGDKERWADLRKVCQEAHQLLPAEKSTAACLAAALANLGEREASSALLSQLDAAGEDDPKLHATILRAAGTQTSADLGLMAREILWFQRHQTDDTARLILSRIDESLHLILPDITNAPAPPRAYTPQQLQAELKRRLTPAERALAVSPIAVTKEIRATANQLTRGLTNAQVKLVVLFAYVAEQRRNDVLAGQQSNTNAPERVCHYYASQVVALARAVGIPAWLVHVDLITDQRSASHDRAAVMLAGRFVQCDPTWGYLCMPWDSQEAKSRVLDDLQAIAHHLCQSSSVPSLRAGLKLDPEDAWTRDICAIHLVEMHEVREAEAILDRLPPESTNRWDYYLARGLIEAERDNYQAARRALEQADKLGPNNPSVMQALGLVYAALKEHRKAQEYLEKAVALRAALYQPPDRHDSDTPDPTTVSLDTLRARAQAGDRTARMVLVNRLFKLGNSDREEALGLLREAAETGDATFQENYGRNLLGVHGPDAAGEAVIYLRKSAEQGYADAQYLLGALQYEGKLVTKDEMEASQWVHLAAAQGNNNARSLLREMQLFANSAAFEEGRKRAQTFKPAPPQAREAAARPAQAAASGTWTATGALLAPSYGCAAALLPDGNVLLAGRAGRIDSTNSQIYEVASGKWTVTPPLNERRRAPTATLLPNGKLLAAGGWNSKRGPLSSAELFDPVSRTWTNTGAMNLPRLKHTATLLPNGKVLVTGGYDGTNDLLTTVEYDPATHTEKRTSVRFHDNQPPNGNGQAAGDTSVTSDSSSTELYDPATGKWKRTGSLNHPRGDHTATLLPNGLVLVAGGFDRQDTALSSAELYAPASGTWTEAGALQQARARHTATLLSDGKVLVVGGQDGNGNYLREAELFDPVTWKWTGAKPMLIDRSHHTATLLANGKVLVAGGHCMGGSTALAEIYEPASGIWTRGMMKTTRYWHTATLLPNGKVLVAGGNATGMDEPLSSAELFDPSPRER